ncbi:MAG: restriction endonuclease [Clostridia bacterium]|nr:restriction endonuclease [Clostridia bacterium]
MARTTKKQEVTPVVTRAEKKDATKNLIREFLQKQQYKHNDLIDEVAKAYTERFSGEDTDNINDVKGRVGSVLDIMKKDGDVTFDGGVYAMKAEEKPKKTTRRTKKSVAEETPNETAEEKPKKTVKRAAKKTTAKKEEKETPSEEKKAEETEEILPLPPAPIQPIAPVAPITPEVAPEPLPEKPKKAVKRTTKKAAAKTEAKAEEKAAEKIEEKPQEVAEKQPEEKHSEPVKAEEKLLEKPVETSAEKPTEKPATAEAKPLMDMSFLFGDPKAKPTPKKQPEKAEKAETPVQSQQQSQQQPQQKQQPKLPQKTEQKKEEVAAKPAEQKPVVKKEAVPVQKPVRESVRKVKKPAPKAMTADEKLKEAFLKRMRQLGGDYFEYYSVYLLEKYSRRNGRRLEGLKITGGDHDGGIDGEIELTDKLGFRETIYIQSKNWDPDKGDEKLWVVGETLVQQFIGACVCRQAKDKKQHCRGIFITTSRFTPDAKSMLDEMSDKVVGYDGNDLYETAKECEFGLVKKNGEWSLDEDLLSGSKAFFNMI